MASSVAEILGDVGGAVGGQDGADADRGRRAVEQVGPVQRAVHPGPHDVHAGAIAEGDVLRQRVWIVRCLGAVDEVPAAALGVAERARSAPCRRSAPCWPR